MPPLLLLSLFAVLSLCFLLPIKLLSQHKIILLLATVLLLFFAGAVQLPAMASLALLATLMYVARGKCWPRMLRLLAGTFAILGVFAIALGKVPGFMTTSVVDNRVLGSATAAFSFKITYGKALVGLLLLVFWYAIEADSKNNLRRAVMPSLSLALLLIGVATCVGYTVDAKWFWFTPYFLLANLCLTVIAEEVFFRAVLQRGLMNALAQYTPYAGLIALVAVSLLFGLLHLKAGVAYAALAGLAGLVYGWVYWRYRSIHAAILCHFSVNLLHFLFLQYPR